MSRYVATLMATVLALSALTGAASAADAPAVARIGSGAVMHPGAGHTLQIQVTNSQTGLLGRAIDHVAVRLPGGLVVFSGAQPPLQGWTVRTSGTPSGEVATFSGGSIPPGGTTTFPLSVDVGRPEASDRSVDASVSTSFDGGSTSDAAAPSAPGALTMRVQVLEVAATAPLSGAQAPEGVRDGTATGSQHIVYGFSVRNHARAPLVVTGQVLATDSRDAVGPSQTRTLGGGGTTWTMLAFSVSLGASQAVSRTAGFVLVAEASGAWASRQGPVVIVEPSAALSVAAIEPTHVRSGQPTDVRVALKKSVGPGLRLTSVRLMVGGGSYVLPEPFVITPPSGNRVVVFEGVTFTGGQGAVEVVLEASGFDTNDAPFGPWAGSSSVVVDDTAPAIALGFSYPTDVYGVRQVAVKNGDPIHVTCSSDDASAPVVAWLVPNAGSQVSAACGGAVRPGYAPTADRFHLVATSTDRAGNTATAELGPVTIDNTPPRLDRARLTSPTTVRLELQDQTPVRGGCDPLNWNLDGVRALAVREVRLADGQRCSGSGAATPQPALQTVRILVLDPTFAVPPGGTAQIGYAACSVRDVRCADNVVDGAGHDLPTGTVEAGWES